MKLIPFFIKLLIRMEIDFKEMIISRSISIKLVLKKFPSNPRTIFDQFKDLHIIRLRKRAVMKTVNKLRMPV